HKLPRLDAGPVDTMRTNGQRLNEGQGVDANAPARHQVFRAHHKIVGHAAIDMHATHLEIYATICLALATGHAVAAAKVREKSNDITRLEFARAINLNDLGG